MKHIYMFIKYLKFINFDINGTVGVWAVDPRIVVGIASMSGGFICDVVGVGVGFLSIGRVM